jgi:hypothetical protein
MPVGGKQVHSWMLASPDRYVHTRDEALRFGLEVSALSLASRAPGNCFRCQAHLHGVLQWRVHERDLSSPRCPTSLADVERGRLFLRLMHAPKCLAGEDSAHNGRLGHAWAGGWRERMPHPRLLPHPVCVVHGGDRPQPMGRGSVLHRERRVSPVRRRRHTRPTVHRMRCSAVSLCGVAACRHGGVAASEGWHAIQASTTRVGCEPMQRQPPPPLVPTLPGRSDSRHTTCRWCWHPHAAWSWQGHARVWRWV